MFKKQKTILIATLALAVLIIMTSVNTFALEATSDKEEYEPGECVVISGSTTNGNVIVSFSVYNPDDSLIALDQVTSGDDGSFTRQVFCFPTEERDNFPQGEYTIIVKDTDTGDELNIVISFTGITETSTESETSTETGTETSTTTETATTETVTETVTETQTIVINNTVTETETVTETQTETTTQVQTTTVTQTETQTLTETVTETQTETLKVTNTGTTIGAAAIALVIGAGAVFALRKP